MFHDVKVYPPDSLEARKLRHPIECIGGPFDGDVAEYGNGVPQGYWLDRDWGARKHKQRKIYKYIYVGDP